ncbi:hypothetical protein Dsin_026965 [Dipteronia sinensis]|uniref:Uncharacterized protein n=1 Tax=Dipteronia sinensis TaxID=43782 RepID=A0AAD9ZYU2_9ROSI|nr:hypothetical protein Dsin_026965 [Dipteronia sinensis]
MAVRSAAAPSEAVTGFDEMVSRAQRKYYMLGRKRVGLLRFMRFLLGIELNKKRLRKSFAVTQKNGGTGMKDLMDGMGLGMLIEQEPSEEEKQAWNVKATEAMEAYKKELEEYNNSIAAATDDKQQPHKELAEEEEHTTTNTIARMPNQRRISLSVSMTVEYV